MRYIDGVVPGISPRVRWKRLADEEGRRASAIGQNYFQSDSEKREVDRLQR